MTNKQIQELLIVANEETIKLNQQRQNKKESK